MVGGWRALELAGAALQTAILVSALALSGPFLLLRLSYWVVFFNAVYMFSGPRRASALLVACNVLTVTVYWGTSPEFTPMGLLVHGVSFALLLLCSMPTKEYRRQDIDHEWWQCAGLCWIYTLLLVVVSEAAGRAVYEDMDFQTEPNRASLAALAAMTLGGIYFLASLALLTVFWQPSGIAREDAAAMYAPV